MCIICRTHRRVSVKARTGTQRERKVDLQSLVPNLDVDHDHILEWLVRLVASDVLDRVDHVQTGDCAAKDAEREKRTGRGNRSATIDVSHQRERREKVMVRLTYAYRPARVSAPS